MKPTPADREALDAAIEHIKSDGDGIARVQVIHVSMMPCIVGAAIGGNAEAIAILDLIGAVLPNIKRIEAPCLLCDQPTTEQPRAIIILAADGADLLSGHTIVSAVCPSCADAHHGTASLLNAVTDQYQRNGIEIRRLHISDQVGHA